MGKFNVMKGNRPNVEEPNKSAEELARKRLATQYRHVTRHLTNDKHLTGDLLNVALRAVRDDAVAEKLKNGEPLSDYEKSLMFDMWLLHLRLGA